MEGWIGTVPTVMQLIQSILNPTSSKSEHDVLLKFGCYSSTTRPSIKVAPKFEIEGGGAVADGNGVSVA